MSFVLELPPHVENLLRAEADALGRDLASVAADRIAASFAVSDNTERLRPFSSYTSEADYTEDARRKGPLFGIAAPDAAAVAEGVADIELGRTISLDEYLAEQKKIRKARHRKHETAVGGTMP